MLITNIRQGIDTRIKGTYNSSFTMKKAVYLSYEYIFAYYAKESKYNKINCI